MNSNESLQILLGGVLLVMLIALGPLLYLHSDWMDDIEKQAEVEVHLLRMKDEAATAHLWFEEWMVQPGGTIDVQTMVWDHFETAIGHVVSYRVDQRALDPLIFEYQVVNLDLRTTDQKNEEKTTLHTIGEVSAALEDQIRLVAELARARAEDKAMHSTGSDKDEAFDGEYGLALTWADEILNACKSYSIEKMSGRKELHDLTLALWALGSLGTGIGLTYLTRRRQRIEHEKKILEGRFQQAQKLESLGVLAGGIAHDFNNLLMAIAGNTSLLLLETDLPRVLRPSLEEIDSGVHKAAALTSQMLAYAGKGKFIETVVDFNQLLEEMGALLSLSISTRVAVDYQLNSEPLPIKGNPTQLQQVVMNLLINASEASEEAGGEIVVRTTIQDVEVGDLEDETLESESFDAGRYILFEVKDSGIGMSEDVKSRCFEPFFSTKFTGRGLGLAAVLGIVRAHGGTIHLDSVEGIGTTFKVYFPLSNEQIIPKAPDQIHEITGSASGEILVIDDDPSVRKIVERMLSKVGFDVEIADSGEAGLEILAKHTDRFDLVLVDMEMPGINGESVGRAIREREMPVRVVLSSGYSEDTVLSPGEDLFDAFIQKPYRVQELWEILTTVLDRD